MSDGGATEAPPLLSRREAANRPPLLGWVFVMGPADGRKAVEVHAGGVLASLQAPSAGCFQGPPRGGPPPDLGPHYSATCSFIQCR